MVNVGNEQLVTIATSFDIVEAEFLRNHLENQGFQVFLADNHIIGVYGLLASAFGGIKIKVPQNESEKAQEFVENLRNAEIVYDDYAPESWKEE